MKEKNQGITLIALIITIIIILILAVVSIDLVIDDKLFDKAGNAVGKTNEKIGQEQNRVDELMEEWNSIESGIKEETPPNLTLANTTFSSNPTGWTYESVTVTASTTLSGYILQTSKDATNWSNESSQTFTSNGTMYARLVTSSGTAGKYVNYNVTNIEERPNVYDRTWKKYYFCIW